MSYNASAIIIYDNFPISITDIENIFRSSTELWLSEHNFPDKLILYHYTNLKGLEGIITERAIRCTQFDHLKDPLELQYGKELIIQKLKYFSNREKNPIVKNFLNELIEDSRFLGQSTTHSIFIASFCDNKNLLNQWRGYGAKGCGYNLGFSFDFQTKASTNTEEINTAIITGDTTPRKFYLRKVIYNIDMQENIIEKYIGRMIEGINRASIIIEKYQKEYGPLLPQIRIKAENLLFDIMISLKNPVFEVEREWRLIRVIRYDELPSIVKFKESNDEDELIPYVNTLLFNKKNDKLEFILQEISFGPILDMLKTKRDLELFIRNSSTSTHIIKLKNDLVIQSTDS